MRLLGIALYGALARVFALFPSTVAEARDFVAFVASRGGRVTKATSGFLRVEQRVAGLDEPLAALVRPGTSDLAVWNQVAWEGQYAVVAAFLDERTTLHVRTVLDIGANVGLSTAYLARAFPDARFLAVEPDPGNYELLLVNTEPFGDRVRTEKAAFWPREQALRWRGEAFRDGREWSKAVEEDSGEAPGHAAIEALTPARVLELLDVDRVDLLKVDIEGAEAEFLGSPEGAAALLDLARALAIEVHPEVVDPLAVTCDFDRAGFLTVAAGELLIAVRREELR